MCVCLSVCACVYVCVCARARAGDTHLRAVAAGASLETHRLFEALEAGAIPVLVRPASSSELPSDVNFLNFPASAQARRLSRFYPVLASRPPFPLLRDWSELPALMTKLGLRDGAPAAGAAAAAGAAGAASVARRRVVSLDKLQAKVARWYAAYRSAWAAVFAGVINDSFR